MLLENAKAISADVTGAMDPTFPSVNYPQNVSYLGKGFSIEKYGGGGGKYKTNDAHAEYIQYMRLIYLLLICYIRLFYGLIVLQAFFKSLQNYIFNLGYLNLKFASCFSTKADIPSF